MRVRLLGPVDVLVDDVPRAVPGLRRTAVLAALALHPGQRLGADRLIDIIWGEAPPPGAAATLRSHVSYLRRALGGPRTIVSRAAGYLLNLGASGTDVQVAEHLLGQASQCADPRRRETLLRDSLTLRRGDPLGGLTDLAWFGAQAQRLDELLGHAREQLIDTRLALGQAARLVPDLEALCRRYPHHEPTHRQLMLALYRSGHQADALDTYHRLCHGLDRDLGITPSQPLRDTYAAILRQDAALDAPPTATPVATPPAVAGTAPARLPTAPASFAGRVRELAELDRLLPAATAADPAPGRIAIMTVAGTAGVGKTTLAVHWAYRVAAGFPDGQLYADLRGFGPTGEVVEPAEALSRFLDALGVEAGRIPATVDARSALFRSLLAGRKVLVVLDNARDSAQVRPLLPGAPGCATLVTSRNMLTGLIASDAARPLPLDPLAVDESRRPLASRVGGWRVAADT